MAAGDQRQKAMTIDIFTPLRSVSAPRLSLVTPAEIWNALSAAAAMLAL